MELKKVRQAYEEMYFDLEFEGETLTLYTCPSFGFVDFGLAQKGWDVRARKSETKKALGDILETLTQEKLAKLKAIGKVDAFAYQAELLLDFDRYSAAEIAEMVPLLGKIKKMRDGVVDAGGSKFYMVPNGTKDGAKTLYWVTMKGASPQVFEAPASWVTIAKLILGKKRTLKGSDVSVRRLWDLLKARHAGNAEKVLRQFGDKEYNAIAAQFLVGKDEKQSQ